MMVQWVPSIQATIFLGGSPVGLQIKDVHIYNNPSHAGSTYKLVTVELMGNFTAGDSPVLHDILRLAFGANVILQDEKETPQLKPVKITCQQHHEKVVDLAQ